MDGDVPAGSGLSSSAAFVCAACLAVMGVHGLELDKSTVASLAMRGERYIGTESGGMDQAISLMGELDVAMLIMFDPVSGWGHGGSTRCIPPPGAGGRPETQGGPRLSLHNRNQRRAPPRNRAGAQARPRGGA